MSASNSPRLSLSKQKQLGPRKRMRAKPKPRVRVKPISAKRRKEAALVGKVFREIEPRDGACRLAFRAHLYPELGLGPCEGDPQPAHLADWRRGTCKLPAEQRSTRKTIVRLCARHHSRYDEHKFALRYLPDKAADGPVIVVPYVKGAA